MCDCKEKTHFNSRNETNILKQEELNSNVVIRSCYERHKILITFLRFSCWSAIPQIHLSAGSLLVAADRHRPVY